MWLFVIIGALAGAGLALTGGWSDLSVNLAAGATIGAVAAWLVGWFAGV
jgi:hypothetical protein